MKLTVGFITYNNLTTKYLADFLASLKKALEFLPDSEYQVFVWDNSDKDPGNRLAIEQFNQNTTNPINYFTEDKNLGFAKAYNQLIKKAVKDKSEYFLVINPDTCLEQGSIEKMIIALDQEGSLGSVSPKILSWDFINRQKTNKIDSCGLVIHPGLIFSDLGQGKEDRGQFDKTNILGPSGAAGLFRIKALKKIRVNGQYFDERFFMYKEDCDLSYRLYLAGYSSQLVPEAIIYHDRTIASSGAGFWSDIVNRRQKDQNIRSWSFLNQHLIFVKHWKKQNFVNKIKIVFRVLSMFIFSLILEQFLLKQYPKLLKLI